MEQCFLCGKVRNNSLRNFESVEECRLPSSQKQVQVVLQHLANCIKTKLVFRPGACVCTECYNELVKYDELMLKLLSFQKKLTQQLHTILTAKQEIPEDDTEFEEVALDETEQLVDEFDGDLDAKEEFIEIEDQVIDDVIVDDDSNLTIQHNSDDDSDYCPARKRNVQHCVVCGSTFKSKLELQNHITEMHDGKAEHTCKICGAVRRDKEYLELHMNIHEGRTENECRYCPKRFSRPVNTLRHMRKHWDLKMYQCEKCGERFSLDNMLYNHRLRHEAEENPLICSICNQSFKSRKTYKHHMTIHREDRPRHYCSLCPKSFTERYTLKVHMKTHNISAPAAIQEVECNESESAVTLIVEENSNECVICSLRLGNKEELEHHLQLVHDVIIK